MVDHVCSSDGLSVWNWQRRGGQRTRDPLANRTRKSYPFSWVRLPLSVWTEHEAERTYWKRSSSMACMSDWGWEPTRCTSALRRVVRAPAIKRKTARTFRLGRVERSCGCTMEGDARSTARLWWSDFTKVSNCSRRWRGTITSATSGAWRTRRCPGPTQSPHPWRCGNWEIRDESRLRMRRESWRVAKRSPA